MNRHREVTKEEVALIVKEFTLCDRQEKQGREWLHQFPPLYSVTSHEGKGDLWYVVDTANDLAVTKPRKTKRAAIRAFRRIAHRLRIHRTRLVPVDLSSIPKRREKLCRIDGRFMVLVRPNGAAYPMSVKE